MAIFQNNVLQGVTANVIQGMQRRKNFGGMEIARPQEQNSLSVNYPVIEIEDNVGIQDLLEKRAFGALFKQADSQIKLDTSTIEGDGLEMPIDNSIISDATKSGLDKLSQMAFSLMNSAFIRHENKVAAVCQGSAFDSVNSVNAYTSANSATANPLVDFYDAIERVYGRGENPDTIVIPIDVWTRIRTFDKFKGSIKGQNAPDFIRLRDLIEYFAEDGITKIIIGRGRQNTAAKGKAASVTPIWSNSHIWVGSTDAAAETGDANSLGMSVATFYNADHPQPYFIEEYESKERRSQVLRVYGETNVKVINARAGTRIATQFA